MELLELFDENEKKLGKKIARGYEPNKGEYIMIVYIFIINKEGKILLEKNSVTMAWVVPGGHVNSSNPQKNIQRECLEELGLLIDISDLKNIGNIIKNNRIFKIYFLKSNYELSDIKLQKEEVVDVNYFTMEEIDDMINNGSFRDNNVMLVDELKKYLHK